MPEDDKHSRTVTTPTERKPPDSGNPLETSGSTEPVAETETGTAETDAKNTTPTETTEEKGWKGLDKSRVAAAVAKGATGIVASLGGFKSLYDVPVWLWQKHGVKKEKVAILTQMYGEGTLADEQNKENTTVSPLDARRNRLEQAINKSTTLSPEKKLSCSKKSMTRFKKRRKHSKNLGRRTTKKWRTCLMSSLKHALKEQPR